MDPNAALEMFLAAIRNGDAETAAECVDNLREWMKKGGASPESLADFVDSLASERDSVFPLPECFYDESAFIDFRIFIRPEGDTELATGDPCYDIDHRGGCGASSVGSGDRIADIRAAVADAFFDAADSMIETL